MGQVWNLSALPGAHRCVKLPVSTLRPAALSLVRKPTILPKRLTSLTDNPRHQVQGGCSAYCSSSAFQ